MAELTKEFIELAQKMQEKTGIPASITLAQIITESSGSNPGGLSGLAYKDKNLFGVKGKGTAGSSFYPTKEFQGGRYVTVQGEFRKYNTYAEAFDDRAKFLSGTRYQKAFTGAKSVNDYANGLKSAGYATDPAYVNKLINTIANNDLHKYDGDNYTFTPVDGSSAPISDEVGGKGIAGSVMKSVVKAILVFMFIILAVIFFMKAFPATDSVLDSTIKEINPLSKKNVKKRKRLKAIPNGK